MARTRSSGSCCISPEPLSRRPGDRRTGAGISQPVRHGRVAAIQLRIVNCRMEVGFYGKLPSHGDFLRRRVSDAFVDAWDAWLRECLAASRTALGDRWLDVYLTSPAWRFVCAAGACGPTAGHRADGAKRRSGRPLFSADARRRAAADVSLVTAASSNRRSSRPPSVWSSRRWRPSASTSRGSISALATWSGELAPLDASPSPRPRPAAPLRS